MKKIITIFFLKILSSMNAISQIEKKTILITVFVFLIFGSSFSQSTFDKVLVSGGYCGNVIKSNDGNIFIAGVENTSNPRWCITKMDSIGNTLSIWRYDFGTSTGYDVNIIQSPLDSGFYVYGAGLGATIMKLNKFGSYQWAKNFTATGMPRFNNAIALNNGGLICSYGEFASSIGCGVMMFDASGNIVWSRRNSSHGTNAGYGLIQASDGNIVITGYINNVTGSVAIAKLDLSGNLIWTKRISGLDQATYCKNICETSDGGYVVSIEYNCQAFILKLDINGNILWQYRSPVSGCTSSIADMVALPSNKIGILGHYPTSIDGSPHFWVMDSNGATAIDRTINVSSHTMDLFGGITKNNSGSINSGSIFCSFTGQNGSGARYEIVKMKPDFTGCSSNIVNTIALDTCSFFTSVTGAGFFVTSPPSYVTPTAPIVTNLSFTTLSYCGPPSTPGAISGIINVCQGSNNTYSISPVSGATSYTWTLPSGWSGTSTTTSINTTASANGGTITVVANNAAGSSSPSTLNISINTPPSTPGSISGNTSICAGSSNTYSITPVVGATSYTWTLPSGWTGTSTANSINTTASSTSGNISVTANNSCGSSPAQNLLVTVNTTPATPGTISGNNSICSGSSNTYSIAPVVGATSYTWTLPGGWTGTSTTNSINTIASATAGNISVTANNSCGSSPSQILPVTINTSPATPGSISGNTTICAGTTNTYSVAPVVGATSYNWTLPGGWTGSSSSETINTTASGFSGNITVSATNSCGTSAIQNLPVTVNTIPAIPGIISGNTTVCNASSNTYSVAPVVGATSYTWTLPGGWTGTSTTNSINTIASATAGNVSVTANNSCGSSPSQNLPITVNTIPATPGIISGNTTVCDGSSNTYSVAPVVGAISYTWTLPSGWTGSSLSENINTISSITSGNISVAATNSCGTSATQNLPVTVNTIPATPGIISGNTIVCDGSSNTYSVAPVVGAISYTWTLPSGWTGSSLSENINTISSITSGNISVAATNSCGTSATQNLPITVNTIPATPGIISGNTTICSGSSNTYSVAPVVTATSYTWTLPGSWTGTSTTNSINTIASVTAGNISVTANNSCGSSPSQNLPVTVNTTPATPGIISGNTTICAGTTNAYSVAPIVGATSYNWTLPGGWTGSSSIETINTTASGVSGNITVSATNSCGTSAIQNLPVTVNTIPATPGIISGNTSICEASSNTYLVGSVAGATSYTWILPSGWNGTSTTNMINAIASSVSGNVMVVANNSCGSSPAQTLAVTVNPLPNVNFSFGLDSICITSGNISLTGSPAGGTFTGDGVTGSNFDPDAAGLGIHSIIYEYTDANSCSNSTTDSIMVTACLGDENIEYMHLSIYPNPTSRFFYIETNNWNESLYVEMYNAMGQLIIANRIHSPNEYIDCNELMSGAYFVKIIYPNTTQFRKVIVTR